MDTHVEISAINIYPVKSFSPIQLDSSFFNKRGLLRDRRWMLIDESLNFISQRSHPQLKLCKLQSEKLKMVISTSDHQSTSLPVSLDSGHSLEVALFDEKVAVTKYEGPANEMLSDYLGENVHFVYQMDDQIRETDSNYSLKGDHVSLADGYPILVANQASLEDLNSRLDLPLDMSRFRPNAEVRGDVAAFDEDHWTGLENDSVSWRVVKPCARCSVTTINEKAKFDKEPLKTLSTYRKIGGKVLFGTNIIADHSGEIKVGDRLNIVRSHVGTSL